MTSATITLKIPAAEKRAASRILRSRGTTLARRLRAFVHEIVEAEEDAADLALARERMSVPGWDKGAALEEAMREFGITENDVANAPDDEIE